VEKAGNIAFTIGAGHRRYSFGQFVLDIDRGALLWDGTDIPLRPKCFEVLSYLVERPGVLITKDELLGAVWAGVVVTEDSLTQCLIQIRKALGDTSKVIVKTVPRRGYLFDIPVEKHDPIEESRRQVTRQAVSQSRKPSRWSVGAAMVLSIAIVATWWSSKTQPPPQPVSTTLPTSIAVLPFSDMSPAGDQEYFADGLSEEVLNLLAQIPGLQVIARTSSFSFKDQNPDIRTIARKLNVAYVLEGSIRKDGDKIRITAQLVSASNSTHLWSQTYDRTLDNVFAVQSEIAESVADVLKVKLLDQSGRLAQGNRDPMAYELLLKGKFFYDRRGSGDIERAGDHFQRALDIDPGLAEAWVGLAGSVGLQTLQGEIPREDGWVRIKMMLDEAFALEPDNAEVHIRLARYYRGTGDKALEQQHFDRAWELGQKSALVLGMAAGKAKREGDIEAAIQLQRRAAALDPVGFVTNGNLASLLYYGGHFDEARLGWLKAADLNPQYTDEFNWLIGLSWIMQEQYKEAETSFQRVPPGAERDQGMAMIHYARGEQAEYKAAMQRLSARTDFNSAYYLTKIFSFHGDMDKSFQWLAETTDRILEADPRQRDGRMLNNFEQCPFLAPIRRDPRWVEWLARIEDKIAINRI